MEKGLGGQILFFVGSPLVLGIRLRGVHEIVVLGRNSVPNRWVCFPPNLGDIRAKFWVKKRVSKVSSAAFSPCCAKVRKVPGSEVNSCGN